MIDIAFGTVKVGINALQVGFETIALAVVETAIKIAEATKEYLNLLEQQITQEKLKFL